MTRIGVNPARGKISSYQPAKVTVAILTCIPNMEGYFTNRLDVLKLVFASLRAHTRIPHDILVFDNGSCAAVQNYLEDLHNNGAINFLLLSHENIGKIGAFNLIFSAAPGEIIAYSDDDILFYPGWLEAQLAILEAFPRVGMISGVPIRNAAGYAHRSMDRLAQDGMPGLAVSYERIIPDEWEADWALSTGRDVEKYMDEKHAQADLVLRMGGVTAIGSANHFQFISQKRIILEALPKTWSGKLMGSMVELDEAIDAMNYLRLSTVERYTRHLGNTLSPALLSEVQQLGIQTDRSGGRPLRSGKPWLFRIPGSRRVIKYIYNGMFDLMNRAER